MYRTLFLLESFKLAILLVIKIQYDKGFCGRARLWPPVCNPG